MATKRTKNDIILDFRGKDFSKMSEKGLADPNEQAHPLKLLELFGGIGAPRRALENNGYNIKSIDYVEVLPFAVMAYNQMFKCGPDPQDIRIWNMSPDIVVHGSPCQDWSNEGKNNINTGRSILFERVLQIVDPNPVEGNPELSKKPKVIIWENVPRLVWSYKDVLDYYIDVLDEFGYDSKYQILTASNYNIPQDRDRVFVVSILRDVERTGEFEFPAELAPKWKLKDYIDKTVDFNDPDVQLSEKEKELFFYNEDNVLCVKEGTKKGYHEVYEWQIINVAFPGSKNRRGRVGNNAKTITTGPRQAIYYDGKIRLLTSKEYLRLMGFKDSDHRKMVQAGLTNSQICTLAGNSICVPVLEQLFAELIKIGVLPRPEDTFEKKKGRKLHKTKEA